MKKPYGMALTLLALTALLGLVSTALLWSVDARAATDAAAAAVERWGVGAGASRLVCGSVP